MFSKPLCPREHGPALPAGFTAPENGEESHLTVSPEAALATEHLPYTVTPSSLSSYTETCFFSFSLFPEKNMTSFWRSSSLKRGLFFSWRKEFSWGKYHFPICSAKQQRCAEHNRDLQSRSMVSSFSQQSLSTKGSYTGRMPRSQKYIHMSVWKILVSYNSTHQKTSTGYHKFDAPYVIRSCMSIKMSRI